MNQITKIAKEVNQVAYGLNTPPNGDWDRMVHSYLSAATYDGRGGDYTVDKFRQNMLIVAAAAQLAGHITTDEIIKERHRQNELWGTKFDQRNTPNDWHAYISHYVATADRENKEQFKVNMMKAAALAQAAIFIVDVFGHPALRHYDKRSETITRICKSCGCLHPKGTMCPPHEVR